MDIALIFALGEFILFHPVIQHSARSRGYQLEAFRSSSDCEDCEKKKKKKKKKKSLMKTLYYMFSSNFAVKKCVDPCENLR